MQTRSKISFLQKIQLLLHPEATEFYHKVEKSIFELKQLQNQIQDPKQLFQNELGGLSYPYYAFTHNKDYNRWVEDMKKIYQMVNSFEDLLQTNIQFLQGNLPMTFYHWSPIYDQDTNGLQLVTEKIKYFTINGQSNECTDEYKQKPYLTGFIPTKTLKNILPTILSSPNIYVNTYDIRTEEHFTNAPFQKFSLEQWINYRYPKGTFKPTEIEDMIRERYNLTLEYNDRTRKFDIPFTNATKDISTYWEDMILNNNLLKQNVKSEIQLNCSVLEIYGREYCQGKIEEFLLSL